MHVFLSDVGGSYFFKTFFFPIVESCNPLFREHKFIGPKGMHPLEYDWDHECSVTCVYFLSPNLNQIVKNLSCGSDLLCG